jgi:hypothetical protein
MAQLLTGRLSVVAVVMVALASALGFSGEASGQSPAIVAARCVRTIQVTGEATRHAIRHATVRGVRAIAIIDASGGSDEDLVNAAAMAGATIGMIGERGATRIGTVAESCAGLLAELEAAPELTERVATSASNQTAGIEQAGASAQAVIAAALERALTN